MVKYTKFFTQIDANAISDANISQKHFKNQKHNNKKIHFFPLLYRFLASFIYPLLYPHLGLLDILYSLLVLPSYLTVVSTYWVRL